MESKEEWIHSGRIHRIKFAALQSNRNITGGHKQICNEFQRNNSLEYCKHLSQTELVNELKQKGTYNPELMAWDVSGVFRFLDRSIVDQYEVRRIFTKIHN